VSRLSAAAGYHYDYYLTLHSAVTSIALVLLYFRRQHFYARARTSLVLASDTAGLACRRGGAAPIVASAEDPRRFSRAWQ
jgi:hypothetical protein